MHQATQKRLKLLYLTQQFSIFIMKKRKIETSRKLDASIKFSTIYSDKSKLLISKDDSDMKLSIRSTDSLHF